ncbi:MAG: HD domain-containing protein [Vicinamibacterales bacterium]|nr:HD domain-containing protein [Vicinamibacterales bacterium]
MSDLQSPTVPDLVDDARRVARAVAAQGGRAVVVGGFVRDRLLGLASKDLDLEVFGIPEDDLRALLATLGRVEPVGQAFPVYKLGAIDVALPRRESKTGRGHKGFEVRGDPSMPFDEAARRRDFTINAIGWDPLTGDHLDPFGGREDLDRRLLRVVDPATFADDSLRVLRALQFAARFDLSMADETKAICRAIPLDDLPAERIWGEMEKLLLQAPRPSIGFALARDLGVVEQILLEMVPLYTCPQDAEWHPEGDVWTHTLMVIDEARRRNADLDRPRLAAIMLGAVCHDLGKPETTIHVEGRVKSPGHEAAGVPYATHLLDRLNVHTLDGFDVRAQVLGIVAEHLRPSAFHKAQATLTDGAFRRLAQKVDLELLARFARADCHGRGGTFDCSAMDWFIDRARTLGVEHRPPAPILMGRHLLELGVPPGPRMGEILRAVYELQLDSAVMTTEEAITAAREIIDARGDATPSGSG